MKLGFEAVYDNVFSKWRIYSYGGHMGNVFLHNNEAFFSPVAEGEYDPECDCIIAQSPNMSNEFMTDLAGFMNALEGYDERTPPLS